MLKRIKKTNGGFTIVEVMIVLAIAAMILLIVLLAVPALQRNSRNTQRKNDASQIAAGVATFISNNGGNLPSGLAVNGNNVLLCATGGAAQATGACGTGNSETVRLGYYTPGQIWRDANTTGITVGTTASATVVTTNSVIIDQQRTCNAAGTDIGGYNQRSAAILFANEGGGNGSLQCIEQ